MSRRVVRALSRAFSTIMVTSLLVLSMAVPMVSAANEAAEVIVDSVQLQDGSSLVTVRLQSFTDVAGINFALLVQSAYVEFVENSEQWGSLSRGVSDQLAILDNWGGDFTRQAVTFVWDGSASGNPVLFTVLLRPVSLTTNPGPQFQVLAGPPGAATRQTSRTAPLRPLIPHIPLEPTPSSNPPPYGLTLTGRTRTMSMPTMTTSSGSTTPSPSSRMASTPSKIPPSTSWKVITPASM